MGYGLVRSPSQIVMSAGGGSASKATDRCWNCRHPTHIEVILANANHGFRIKALSAQMTRLDLTWRCRPLAHDIDVLPYSSRESAPPPERKGVFQ
jgi:hypothetical protein